jgi:hypothetical protein
MLKILASSWDKLSALNGECVPASEHFWSCGPGRLLPEREFTVSIISCAFILAARDFAKEELNYCKSICDSFTTQWASAQLPTLTAASVPKYMFDA